MVVVRNFHSAISNSSLTPAIATVMNKLFQLYSLYTMDADARTFSTTGATASLSLDKLQDVILDLMTQVRPHAVRLVDSWSMPDYLLQSALGRYDGKVYEDLFDRAHRQNPLNKVTFNIDWESEEIVLGSGDQGKTILAKL
jgi:acyl-CoA oxidase